jgi:hypothetical protein
MDDLTALIIKYTSKCWCEIWWGTSLEFLCPPYAVLGDPCPPCPGRIALVNCASIGLGGGIDDIIYLGILWFPEFANWVSGFAQIVFLSGHFGSTLASIGDYLTAAVDRFTDIPAGQQSLFSWCFGYTSPSMAGPILFFVLGWLIFGFLWSIFLLAISAVWEALVASPVFWVLPGATSQTMYEALGNNAQYEQQAYVEVEVQTVADDQGVARRIYVPIQRRLPTHQQSLLFASLDSLWARALAKIGRDYT